VTRILDFPIHDRYPTVVHLAVHLENGQRVYFTEDNLLNKVNKPPRTALTAFFLLWQKNNFASTRLYCLAPKGYTWNALEKAFKCRVHGIIVSEHPDIKATDALGRVYTAHPNNLECFFLRFLLHTIRDPTSFTALKTVNGQICEIFREACQRMGLLEGGAQRNATMAEAASAQSPAKLRNLFVLLLLTYRPSSPEQL
jgi:hypothetical protein